MQENLRKSVSLHYNSLHIWKIMYPKSGISSI